MRTKTRLLSYLLILIAALAFAGVATASTPDGETPANEGVCDPLIGLTPGLFGLCNAFCEAQDCDFAASRSNQCEPPNQRILINYEKKRKAGDPPMPCIEVEDPCPCWSLAELAVIDDPNNGFCFTSTANFASLDETAPFLVSATVSGDVNDGNVQHLCTYTNNDPNVNIGIALLITQAEAQTCRAQLEAQALSAGYNCF